MQMLRCTWSHYAAVSPQRRHVASTLLDRQFVSSRDQGHAKYHAHLPRRHLPTEATVIVRYSSMPLCASAPNPPYSHVEYRDGCEVRGSGRSVPGGNPQHCMEDTSGNVCRDQHRMHALSSSIETTQSVVMGRRRWICSNLLWGHRFLDFHSARDNPNCLDTVQIPNPPHPVASSIRGFMSSMTHDIIERNLWSVSTYGGGERLPGCRSPELTRQMPSNLQQCV